MNSLLEEPIIQALLKKGVLDADQLSAVERVAPLFDDSSCQLWKLYFENSARIERQILKVSGREQDSPFWKMMRELFDVSIDTQFQHAETIYGFLQDALNIDNPVLIKSGKAESLSFVLMSELSGQAVRHEAINDKMVVALAQNLSQLHQYTCQTFGSLVLLEQGEQDLTLSQAIGMDAWQSKLSQTLQHLSKVQDLSVQKAVAECKQLEVSRFVPLMMDLRWDQFAEQEGRLTGIFDLDAFVCAPIEFDFVILEYLLNQQQLALFKKTYEANSINDIPPITSARISYRTLFYLVNALGETDFQRWMSQPEFFD